MRLRQRFSCIRRSLFEATHRFVQRQKYWRMFLSPHAWLGFCDVREGFLQTCVFDGSCRLLSQNAASNRGLLRDLNKVLIRSFRKSIMNSADHTDFVWRHWTWTSASGKRRNQGDVLQPRREEISFTTRANCI